MTCLQSVTGPHRARQLPQHDFDAVVVRQPPAGSGLSGSASLLIVIDLTSGGQNQPPSVLFGRPPAFGCRCDARQHHPRHSFREDCDVSANVFQHRHALGGHLLAGAKVHCVRRWLLLPGSPIVVPVILPCPPANPPSPAPAPPRHRTTGRGSAGGWPACSCPCPIAGPRRP